MALSPKGNTDLINMVAGIFLRDILALYLFEICLDYVFRTLINLIKENGFILKKGQKKTITCWNNNKRRLHRWSNDSWKYAWSSRIPTV